MKKISLYKLAYSLFRIPRSLAGEGNRNTLKILSKFTNDKIKIRGFKSGKKFNGWKIPKEWKVLNASVKDPTGKKIIDFERNNLELVSYSQSFKGKLNLKQFKEKIFTIKKLPRAVPYITAYYKENFWSVCMSFIQFF